MTKADKLRAAGRTAGAEGLTSADVTRIAGNPAAICNMTKTGEFTVKKTDAGKRYILDLDYTPPKQRKIEKNLPIKRGKKKRAARKSAKRKSLREIARRVAAGKPDLRAAATENLIGAGAMLAIAVRNGVEGIEENPSLLAALQNHERAEKLHAAA